MKAIKKIMTKRKKKIKQLFNKFFRITKFDAAPSNS